MPEEIAKRPDNPNGARFSILLLSKDEVYLEDFAIKGVRQEPTVQRASNPLLATLDGREFRRTDVGNSKRVTGFELSAIA